MSSLGRESISASSEQAHRYAQIRYRLLFIDLVVSWVLLFCLQFGGFSRAITAWAQHQADHPVAILALYLLIFGPLTYVVALPLHVYRSYFLEHRFGLSRLTPVGWLTRELKHLAVGTVFGFALAQGLYALLRVAPDTWPLWATLAWLFVSVLMARVFPTVLLPIFYKTSRLENPDLEERLLRLCRRVGVLAMGVFRFDMGAETRKANAALAGLGKTRRVLLSDTLLENFPADEIEGVLAHELAHHHYRHILKGLAIATLGSLFVFWLTSQAARFWVNALELEGLPDPAGLPILMLWLSVLAFASQPIQNGISRLFEWEADRFAVRMSESPGTFAAALRRLGDLNLADPAPPAWIEWFFYDHPAIHRRIAAAERAAAP